MRPTALMLALAASLAFAPATPDDPKADDDRVVLDSAKVGEAVEVRAGEEVVLKLPARMPRWWILTRGKDALERVIPEGKTENDLPFEDMTEPGKPPVLGRPKWFKPAYRVTARAGTTVEVEWVYSEFGRPPAEDKRTPYDPETLKDEDGNFALEKFEPGLVYKVKLKVVE